MSNDLIISMDQTMQGMVHVAMIIVIMGVVLFIIVWLLSRISN